MRFKWLALTFFLGLVVMLDPTQTPGQQGPGKEKGKFGKGGGFGGGFNPSGAYAPPGQLPGSTPSFQPSTTTPPAPAPNFGNNGFGGQPGGNFGGGTPGGFGGGPGGFGGNPADGMWMGLQRNTNSTGDTADLNQLTPDARDRMSQRLGVPLPNGVISRDQFNSMYAQSPAAQGGGRGMRPGGGPGQPPVVVMMPSDQFGRDRNRFDPNGAPDNWDNGGNPGPNNEKGSRDRRSDKKEVEEEKPALRYGKIPKEILETYPWFEEYDLDKDGQVALWEWRKSGGSISEFNSMDLNGDGLITADELVRWKMRNDEAAKIALIEAGERPKPANDKDKDKRGGPGGPRGPKPANAADGNATDKEDKAIADKDKTAEKPAGERPKGPQKDNPWQNGGGKDDGKQPQPRRKN